MHTKFRFLDQLEQDLQAAAALEGAPASQRGTLGRSDRRGIRRSPGSVAAALVVLLVIAGAIGVLSQFGGDGTGSESFGGSAAEPATGPAKGVAGGGSGTSYSTVEQESAAATAVPGTFQDNPLRDDRTRSEQLSPQQGLTKIVRDGAITVVVPADGFGEAFDRATAIAEEAGGFVLSSSISQENQGSLTLRVPARRLDGAVVQLRGLGRLAELSLSGHDVTADYIDLKARLQVLQTQRELIVKLLNDSTSVGGQLSLSNRFADVQTQIEQIQGSLNVLNDKVDLATLKVTLREEGVAAAPGPDDIEHPSLGSAWDRAVQGFFNVIAAVVVGLGYLIPLLVLAGVALLIRRAVIRRRAAS